MFCLRLIICYNYNHQFADYDIFLFQHPFWCSAHVGICFPSRSRLLQAAACLCVIFLVFAPPSSADRARAASGFSLSSLLMLSPSPPFARYEWTTSRNTVQRHQNQAFHLSHHFSAVFLFLQLTVCCCQLVVVVVVVVEPYFLLEVRGWDRKLECDELLSIGLHIICLLLLWVLVQVDELDFPLNFFCCLILLLCRCKL